MTVYTPDTVKNAEKYMFENGLAEPIALMKKAAYEMSKAVLEKISPKDKIIVLCGKGNNAGDGYELADILIKKGFCIVCAEVFGSPPSTDIARECRDGFVSDGGKIISKTDDIIEHLRLSSVVIDAVFGIGFKGEIKSDTELYKIIEASNSHNALKTALDVPSGIDSELGSVGGIAFKADFTVTVTAPKIGMLSYPARLLCGEIISVDIGVEKSILDKFGGKSVVCDDAFVSKALPKRSLVSNKGDFGKLLCICGSENMPGAAAMAVSSALRSGVGLVTLASEKSVNDIVKIKYCEPIYENICWDNAEALDKMLESIDKYSAVLVGCGLGKSEEKRNFLFRLIKTYSGRLIIDADGINMLSENINILREAKQPPVLTPHPGEFSRISGLSIGSINAERIKCAAEFSQTNNCITVLKGAGTVVSDGERIAVNTTGNPGLAKGGSGDVLAGLIAGLCANPSAQPFECAVCGTYLHGKAADILAGKTSEYGMLPSELPEETAKLLP